DPLESRLFTLKSSRTEPDQLNVTKYELGSLKSDVGATADDTTGVSIATPTSGVEDSE
ncbi:hypothetical protein A2U01_0072524, partial [Trifolium medium]|nr:hypothetical protein [Trifolium medium]